MDQISQIKALLPTELFEGSKDWTSSDVVGRVEWLLAMYENVKAERDRLENDVANLVEDGHFHAYNASMGDN